MKKNHKQRLLAFLGTVCFGMMFLTLIAPHMAHAEEDFIKVSTYEMELASIHKSNPPSVEQILMAKDLYFKTFTDADSPETRDAAFAVFFEFYSKIAENAYQEQMFSNLPYQEGPEMEEAKKLAAKYGLQLLSGEGDYYPAADSRLVFKMFESHLSDAYKAYLILTDKTSNLVSDAALTVDHEELRKIILFGDAILQRYPNSVVLPLVKKEIHDVFYLYFLGMDNTPVYNWDNKVILPEVRSSYEAFLKENKNSSYYSLMKSTYDLIKKNHFTYTNKFRDKLVDKLRKDGVL